MGNLQERYVNYLLHSGYTEDELIHYGVPGMKWGVRKATYLRMDRAQRKALKGAAEGFRDASDLRKRLTRKVKKADRRISRATSRGKDASKHLSKRSELMKALADLTDAETNLERNTKSSFSLDEYNRDSAISSAKKKRALIGLLSSAGAVSSSISDTNALKKRFASENRYDEQGKLKKV